MTKKNQTPGLDLAALEPWLEAHLTGRPPPYHFELIIAGGSNLTYVVSDHNGERFILRRPPVKARLATAHDMAREHRIMRALAASAVPVPEMLALCENEDIVGAPFYCMERVEGLILHDKARATHMSERQCRKATESLVEVQIAFHQIDLEAVGLADLGRHDDYVQRQLRRWHKQIHKGSSAALPYFDSIHAELIRSVPQSERPAGLAHGDYRFDNTVLDESSYTIKAVLDWELCTIGDPIADLCWSLNYWANSDEHLTWLLDPPTALPHFPKRESVQQLYQERAGFVLPDLSWHHAFSWWKQACIVDGVRERMSQGAQGGMQLPAHISLDERVADYLKRAEQLLAG